MISINQKYLHIFISGIKKLVGVINNFYKDNQTAFVMTSDHGMSEWGMRLYYIRHYPCLSSSLYVITKNILKFIYRKLFEKYILAEKYPRK